MRTPSTIEALEGAIQMLRDIQRGKIFGLPEYTERLQAYELARDSHHHAELQRERTQAQLRELSAQARGRTG